MKKTLLVTLDFFPAVGGVSRYWVSLGKHMPLEQWVVLAPPLSRACSELQTHYRVYREPFFWHFFPHWLPLVWSLIKVLFRERPSILIAAQVLPVGTAVFFISRLFRIPYIVSTHGMDVTIPLNSPRKMKLCSRIFKNAKKIITVSAYTAAKIKNFGIHESHIDFIYPCPVLAPQGQLLPFSANKKELILLTVGRLVKRKGHEYVLDAIAQLAGHEPPLYYVVVGDGPEKYNLVRHAQELGLGARVLFTGVLADESVKQWYRKCDIFIMTPYEIGVDAEGFGIVYLEASSFGKPVIASRSGGVEDAVLDEISGLIIEKQDVKAIRDAIVKLCSSEALRRRLGEHGKQRVEREFQWSVQAKKLQDIIDKLL